MKKFLRNIVLFASILVVIQLVFFVTRNNPTHLAGEVYDAISKTGEKTDYTGLLLGDSVCNQLFHAYQKETDKILYVGTNQAITVCGNYLLLRDFMDQNPQLNTVYYFVRPQSLVNDMFVDYSYQYFVLPFYQEKYLSLLDEETKEMLENKFGAFYINNKVVKRLLQNNSVLMKGYLNRVQAESKEKREVKQISALSINYLKKMQLLCEERGIKFRVVAAPLMDVDSNKGWAGFEQDIMENGFEDILKGYVDNICYYEEEAFSDGVHFTDKYIEANREEILRSCFGEFPIQW